MKMKYMASRWERKKQNYIDTCHNLVFRKSQGTHTYTLLEPMSNFNKVIRYRINYKNQLFLYTFWCSRTKKE
jgi:hypothetical protein